MKRTLVAVFLLIAFAVVGVQVVYGQVTDPPICYPDDNDCEPTPTPEPGCPATEPGCPPPPEPTETPVPACPPDENGCPPPDCPATEPGCPPPPEPTETPTPEPPDENYIEPISLVLKTGYKTIVNPIRSITDYFSGKR